MAQLFSYEWMQGLADRWNRDTEMLDNLAQAGFSASIGFGHKGDEHPAGVVEVKDGRIRYAGNYDGQELDWDLRASPDDWRAWIEQGFGLDKLGVAVSSGRLAFAAGDYRKMIRTPNLAKPFLRNFELMSELKTEYV
ncbi:MAG: SCP-2 sterol transfer family protein [Granulosicoccaceae bacterium]